MEGKVSGDSQEPFWESLILSPCVNSSCPFSACLPALQVGVALEVVTEALFQSTETFPPQDAGILFPMLPRTFQAVGTCVPGPSGILLHRQSRLPKGHRPRLRSSPHSLGLVSRSIKARGKLGSLPEQLAGGGICYCCGLSSWNRASRKHPSFPSLALDFAPIPLAVCSDPNPGLNFWTMTGVSC